ncbi:hypothetical protein CROQUDRAFT_280978 [Cronartium quercuum f. sp. fusiforme G11]|uniref:Uncharacterized protein n=1 Tax=Cronartium quercuum f. sp. fusiforme G11 TaxID=708437 RepID=A0A9P6NCF4_9BASI|nr:hypothetical protein CROQUDRAFT_280978 [Cronartium quercuum f. sp. fusiforme G11]
MTTPSLTSNYLMLNHIPCTLPPNITSLIATQFSPNKNLPNKSTFHESNHTIHVAIRPTLH